MPELRVMVTHSPQMIDALGGEPAFRTGEHLAPLLDVGVAVVVAEPQSVEVAAQI